jgi:hypothetical protein
MNEQLRMMKKFIVICRDFQAFDEYLTKFTIQHLTPTLNSTVVSSEGATVGEWHSDEAGHYIVLLD